jgi:hypothetical protein
MRLINWQRLGIIASLVWVAVGPTYFHLSQEDNDKRVARDQYQLCIQNRTAKTGGVERCNKDLRQALAIAHWSSWAKLAFIPLVLAWLVGWGLFFLVSRVRGRPQAVSGHDPQGGNARREAALPRAKDDEERVQARQEAYDQLRIARGKAIQSYAGLERALCSLLANFLQASPDIAATLFYRNANANSRNEILCRLFEKRYGDGEYGPFWKSAINRVSGLDRRRNEIVHWQEAEFQDGGKIQLNLIAGNLWDRTPNSVSLGIDELNGFVAECDFVTRSLSMFDVLLNGALQKSTGSSQPWHDICQKPMTYPPPDGHPLSKVEREA